MKIVPDCFARDKMVYYMGLLATLAGPTDISYGKRDS
jgi:hypothetical protein